MNFKELSFDRLCKRVERLSIFLDRKEHSVVISKEVVLVVKAAIGYCGREFTDSLLNWLYRSLCVENGFCAECREQRINTKNEKGIQMGLCDACLEAFEKDIPK